MRFKILSGGSSKSGCTDLIVGQEPNCHVQEVSPDQVEADDSRLYVHETSVVGALGSALRYERSARCRRATHVLCGWGNTLRRPGRLQRAPHRPQTVVTGRIRRSGLRVTAPRRGGPSIATPYFNVPDHNIGLAALYARPVSSTRPLRRDPRPKGDGYMTKPQVANTNRGPTATAGVGGAQGQEPQPGRHRMERDQKRARAPRPGSRSNRWVCRLGGREHRGDGNHFEYLVLVGKICGSFGTFLKADARFLANKNEAGAWEALVHEINAANVAILSKNPPPGPGVADQR